MTRKSSRWPWFGLGALAGLAGGWLLTRRFHRLDGTIETGKTNVQQLNDVSETLLLPLAYRAAESRRPDGVIHDPKAAEIVAQLAYDFSKLERQRFQQLSVGLRAREFDRAVRAFLAEHPDGVVVDIGCGLDTRFERVDNGQVTWFALDFPEVIALRERFFTPHPRCHPLACSALEFGWMDEVAQHPGPHFFLAEGVFPYLAEDDLKSLLLTLRDRFPGAELMFDMLPALMAYASRLHPAIRQTRAARVRWATNDSRAPEKWGVGRLLSDWRYYNHDEPRLGWYKVCRYVPFMRDFRVLRYRLADNLARTQRRARQAGVAAQIAGIHADLPGIGMAGAPGGRRIVPYHFCDTENEPMGASRRPYPGGWDRGDT